MWLNKGLFYWLFLWWLNTMNMNIWVWWSAYVLGVSNCNVNTGEGLQMTHCSVLFCHIKKVFVLEKLRFPTYACWVFHPSSLLIHRNKVLFIVFAFLIVDFSVANYYRDSFQEKGRGDRLSTSLLYIKEFCICNIELIYLLSQRFQRKC